MAMTAAVKDELSRVDVPKPCCRRAEMAALLRFAGGLHIVSGRVVVEAELDTGAVARRLRTTVADLYGYPSEIHVALEGDREHRGGIGWKRNVGHHHSPTRVRLGDLWRASEGRRGFRRQSVGLHLAAEW